MKSDNPPPGPPPESVRVLTWNLQWRRDDSAAGRLQREMIAIWEPDVVCVTEAHCDLDLGTGFWIRADPNYGHRLLDGRRKVQLWSRHPWSAVDATGNSSLPSGRYVSGVTATRLGQMRIAGICIPWKDAHVRSGRRDRRPWDDHVHFLEGLDAILAGPESVLPDLVMGDFNQTIPRTRAPERVYLSLRKAFDANYSIATAGRFPEAGNLLIDHIACGKSLAASSVHAFSPILSNGNPVSDHSGVVATFHARVNQIAQ